MVETSITADTPENLFYRTGSLTLDGVSLGALEGDISFAVRREYDIPDVCGCRGEARGTRHITKEYAVLSANIVEWQLSTLANLVPGAGYSSDGSSEVLGSDTVERCISDDEYHMLVFTGTQCDGKTSTILMSNVIIESSFELTFRDQGHFSTPVEFRTTVTRAAPRSRPWAIARQDALRPILWETGELMLTELGEPIYMEA